MRYHEVYQTNRSFARETLAENDPMAVDPKRVEAIFLAAVDAADPNDQAAILDRECASNGEMRARVEALLRSHRESATIIGERDETRFTPVPSGMDGATRIGPPPDPNVPEEHVEPVSLEFLEPSSEAGSLGRLGHHEVLQVLGRGGFGIVVRAFDETLRRMVAIKVLSPELASTSPARKRFLREARASARVRHDNVVQIYAVEERPLPYLVMEYIPGQTLQERLDQTGPLDVPYILRLGAQIARGLAAAHEQGLIHRDIKPGNILLESGIEPKVKITDFGLARAADDASLSQSGVIAGTPLYMAPEQAKGEMTDPRADLFSLGSVLYTMSAGHPPFRAATALAVMKRVAEDTPRPIRQIIPEVPQWLCDIIAKLHAKDPAQRFQSATDVAALLEQHLAYLQQPSLATRPDSLHVPRPRNKARTLAILTVTTVLLLGAALAYAFRPRAETTAVIPSQPEAVLSGKPAESRGVALVRAVDKQIGEFLDGKPATAIAPGLPRTVVLQGRAAVRDALIDFAEPERRFGDSARDNPVRRADQCNAFLVHFDLPKPGARVEKATLSVYVWDPSSAGKTKLCAFPLKTAWDEETVTWREPSSGKSWRGGAAFAFGTDTGPPGLGVVVPPEQGSDTADPPIEYQLDVTDLVRSWLNDTTPNHGLAIAPVNDPSVDENLLTRFQILGSEHKDVQFTPTLTMQMGQ